MSDDKKDTSEQEQPKSGRRQRSALIYLVILFAAAFLMLLLAYFMQQRSSEEIMGNLNDLQQSMGSIQSIDRLREENQALKDENQALQKEIDGLKEQVSALEEENEHQKQIAHEFEVMLDGCTDTLDLAYYTLEKTRIATMFFWQINEAYVLEDYDLCRDLIDRMRENFFEGDPTGYLADGSEGVVQGRPAAERYQEILAALNVETES